MDSNTLYFLANDGHHRNIHNRLSIHHGLNVYPHKPGGWTLDGFRVVPLDSLSTLLAWNMSPDFVSVATVPDDADRDIVNTKDQDGMTEYICNKIIIVDILPISTCCKKWVSEYPELIRYMTFSDESSCLDIIITEIAKDASFCIQINEQIIQKNIAAIVDANPMALEYIDESIQKSNPNLVEQAIRKDFNIITFLDATVQEQHPTLIMDKLVHDNNGYIQYASSKILEANIDVVWDIIQRNNECLKYLNNKVKLLLKDKLIDLVGRSPDLVVYIPKEFLTYNNNELAKKALEYDPELLTYMDYSTQDNISDEIKKAVLNHGFWVLEHVHPELHSEL